MNPVHTIPVGGDEPLHIAAPECWCFPQRIEQDPALYVHNAQDCREAKERQGITLLGRFWVMVMSANLQPA